MEKVDEKKKTWITVSFRDRTGVLAAPTTARYRIDDRATRREVKPWTSLTPATSITIEVLPASNTILNDKKQEEIKVLTTEAVYGADATDDVLTAEYEYAVRNLQFYPKSNAP